MACCTAGGESVLRADRRCRSASKFVRRLSSSTRIFSFSRASADVARRMSARRIRSASALVACHCNSSFAASSDRFMMSHSLDACSSCPALMSSSSRQAHLFTQLGSSLLSSVLCRDCNSFSRDGTSSPAAFSSSLIASDHGKLLPADLQQSLTALSSAQHSFESCSFCWRARTSFSSAWSSSHCSSYLRVKSENALSPAFSAAVGLSSLREV
mmetsp:Transcript_91675/g.163168  ORF Transcript_91675/g.163168 Transcript_91675/m.163168 type:complete len:213 (+) Transcript_91675:121-759(+)